jgi:hypothetical protein
MLRLIGTLSTMRYAMRSWQPENAIFCSRPAKKRLPTIIGLHKGQRVSALPGPIVVKLNFY